MSATIREIYGLPEAVPAPAPRKLVDSTCLGIEHELENLPDSRRKAVDGWKIESDGSLRNNGAEYVFNGPKGGSEAEDAIIAIHEMLSKTKHDINERTSTHVHVDFRNLTLKDVARFAAIYSLIEPVLFKMCDESRTDNPFCVPVQDSVHLKYAIKKMMEGRDNFGPCREQNNRYGAINFASLPRYGTVEVRMRETITAPDELIAWCNIFLSIRQYVVETGIQPIVFVERCEEHGISGVFCDVLGAELLSKIISSVPDFESLVDRSICAMKPTFYTWETAARRESIPTLQCGNLYKLFADKTGDRHITGIVNSQLTEPRSEFDESAFAEAPAPAPSRPALSRAELEYLETMRAATTARSIRRR